MTYQDTWTRRTPQLPIVTTPERKPQCENYWRDRVSEVELREEREPRETKRKGAEGAGRFAIDERARSKYRGCTVVRGRHHNNNSGLGLEV